MEWVMVLMPIGLLILGFPIFIILLATSAIILLFFMQVPLTAVHQVMFGSVDKFALMAVPFFIFAGELMGMGGISQRIIAWVMSVIGGMRGSLPLTTVGTCTIFGAISGSSPATVAAVGRLMYPPLREKGYDEKFSTGVLTSSGAIAIVIPPSISMILYGASAEQSVSHLFIAGIFPGLLMSLMMGGYIYWYAARRDIREGQPFDMSEFLRASKSGIWALGTPGIILGGIYAGVFSPTEAAGIACVYAILVTKFIYGDISWRGIWDVSINSMYLTAQVLIIVAGAGVFSWLLTVSGIPQAAVAAIQALDVPPLGHPDDHQRVPADRRLPARSRVGDPGADAAARAHRRGARRRPRAFRGHHDGEPRDRHVHASLRAQHLRRPGAVQGAAEEHLSRAGAVHRDQHLRAGDRHLRARVVALPVEVPRLTRGFRAGRDGGASDFTPF